MPESSIEKPRSPFVPPVWLVGAVLRLRRALLRAADAIVPSYLGLHDRFMGAAMSALVRTAAELRIADLLVDGPLDATQIAARTGTRPDLVDRALRALISIGVFRRNRDGTYRNNHVSKGLITGAKDNTRGFNEFFGLEPVMRGWAQLPKTLREGGVGFEHAHGKSTWEWMAGEAQARTAFVDGMTSMTELVAWPVAASYPFDEVKTLCDVGGGGGVMLGVILTKHPHLRGILAEDASMLREAPAFLKRFGMTPRELARERTK